MAVTAGLSAGSTRAFRRNVKLAAGIVAVAALAGIGGWQAPQLVARYTEVSYLGAEAATVAEDLECAAFKRSPEREESAYRYRDQGTCVLDGTTVTITTFDETADGEAFLTLMNGLIPVLHPTWKGAASAAGDGWNVADTGNLSPDVAERVVLRLGVGEVRVIPSASRD